MSMHVYVRVCGWVSCAGLKSKEEVASVEIAGGCTRIPWVQRCISGVFGLELSRTLAGDETVARGCALQVSAFCLLSSS